MKIDLCNAPAKSFCATKNLNFKSKSNEPLLLSEQKEDSFEYLEDGDILAGPFGHPHSGRPVGPSLEDIKNFEENMTLTEWLLNPERKLYKRPKTVLGKMLSLKDIKFDDEVSKFSAEKAAQAASNAAGTLKDIKSAGISIGDIDGDGIIDTIVSGINVAIDIDGDGTSDVVGTLIDTTGDGIADFVRDAAGKLIKINGNVAQVVKDSNIDANDAQNAFELIKNLVNAAFNK